MPDAHGATPVDEARRLLAGAVADRLFPAAVAEVGDDRKTLWSEPFGTLTFDEGAPPASLDTIFDLASLTKPLATATAAIDLAARGLLGLDERLADVIAGWRGDDRAAATVADLLEHASGLPARLVDAPGTSRREFEHDIAASPLEYGVRTRSIYSDLGFILLGFVVEDRAGERLDASFARIVRVVADAQPGTARALRDLGFAVDPARRAAAAPTDAMAEDTRRGQRLVGVVHDNYAAALGGIAGHAGLFGTAASLGAFARTLLGAAQGRLDAGHPLSVADVARAVRRSTVAGSSRALGWDTMLQTSSCGTRMSTRAFGHVGFTGTSLWIDPGRNRYAVLLANRVCGGGSIDAMRLVRRAFHDAVADL